MTTTISVMYPNVEGATFDMAYYLEHHMPLVARLFRPHGLANWRVLNVVGAPGGDKPAFSVVALLEFETAAQFHAAVEADGGPVFGDVPNFSNQRPTILIADNVGAG